jgi:LPS sulfotransferase NodH
MVELMSGLYPALAVGRRFAVLTAGRSGSELLIRSLAQHPQIVCDSELLAQNLRHPSAFIRGRAVSARLRGARAYGFKVLINQVAAHRLDPNQWIPALVNSGWLLIHLRRRNLLDQAISALRAQRTKYHYLSSEAPDFAPMRFDPIELVSAMYLLEDLDRKDLRALAGSETLEVFYEDDLYRKDDRDATLSRIFDRLDLPRARVSTDLIRVHPEDARDMVSNYDEIAKVLRTTRFSHFVE